MSTPTIILGNRYSKQLLLAAVTLILLLPLHASAEWKVDLTRRQKTLRQSDMQANQAANAEKERTIFNMLFESGEPVVEMVVLNTDKGFVPNTLRLRKGAKYTVHVVNINEKEKNVSFVLDSFSEHHATYYGKIKTFQLEPKKEGIFSFQCPETSSEGRVVVYAPPNSNNVRAPSNEGQ